MSDADGESEDVLAGPMSRQESEAFQRARRGRNIALALGLVAFVIIVFVVTVIRLQANVLEPRF